MFHKLREHNNQQVNVKQGIGAFKMKILSFIIPAYNSEQFLDKCVRSMLAPEVLSKLEIIIVNDGSRDGTAATAEIFYARYPDVVRLISQENKGHGGALNTGCAAARGKYLKVIDADDWVVTENIAAFISCLEQCESDVVLTHHHTIDIGTGEIRNWQSYPEEFGRAYTFAEIMPCWRSFERSLTFHGITYRTDFYRQHLHLLSEHVFYEDHEFATFPCCHAQGITPLDLFVYEYRIGDVNQSVSNANQIKRIGHMETVLHRMLEIYTQLPDSPGKDYAAQKILGVLISYLTTVLLVNPDRKSGRQMAKAQIAFCNTNAPEIHKIVYKKYQAFRLMNYLHINKKTLDQLIQSRLYIRLMNKQSFR